MTTNNQPALQPPELLPCSCICHGLIANCSRCSGQPCRVSGSYPERYHLENQAAAIAYDAFGPHPWLDSTLSRKLCMLIADALVDAHGTRARVRDDEAATADERRAKNNDYNVTKWRKCFERRKLIVPYSDDYELLSEIKYAARVIELLYKEVLSLRATTAPIAASLENQNEIRFALEGMIAAFDADDYGDASIVATTRECALSVAKQAVGWDNIAAPQDEQK